MKEGGGKRMGRKIMRLIVVGMVLALVLGLTGQALAAGEQGRPLQRMIVFTEEPAVNKAAKAAVEAHSGFVLENINLPGLSGLVVAIPEHAKEPVTGIAGVIAVEPDLVVSAVKGPPEGKGPKDKKDPYDHPPEVLPWGVNHIDADLVWGSEANIGSGVDVAIVDSGIDKQHPDLVANIAGGINYIGKGSPWKRRVDPDAWDDEDGHGTFCAGVVAAADNEEGVIGVGPGISLWAVRVLDESGRGRLSDLIAGIYWAGDPANGIEVMNLSVGVEKDILEQYPNDLAALEGACDYAEGQGVVLVGAAGNSGNSAGTGDNVIYPARFDSVIAVAATDSTDTRASWSSTGPVELAAPGVDIESTYLPTYGGYAIGNGTSFAAPHVAGTAALVLASDDTLTNEDVRAILQATADSIGPANWYGSGLVDAEKASTSIETP